MPSSTGTGPLYRPRRGQPERHLREPRADRGSRLFGGDEVQIGKFRLLFMTRSPEVGSAAWTREHRTTHEKNQKKATENVSIGQVLDELRPEFPDISPSKIRFLESEGLIQPLRSSSGYRRFAVADIERLRFILTAQRDEYLPLRVIKDRLDEVDGTRRGLRAGEALPPAVPMTRSELLTASGAAEGLLAESEDYGLVRRARAYGTQALSVAAKAVLSGPSTASSRGTARGQGVRRPGGLPCSSRRWRR